MKLTLGELGRACGTAFRYCRFHILVVELLLNCTQIDASVSAGATLRRHSVTFAKRMWKQ